VWSLAWYEAEAEGEGGGARLVSGGEDKKVRPAQIGVTSARVWGAEVGGVAVCVRAWQVVVWDLERQCLLHEAEAEGEVLEVAAYAHHSPLTGAACTRVLVGTHNVSSYRQRCDEPSKYSGV
jgi:hypothetical protein